MEDNLTHYTDEDILHDYMMMAEDYDQDDTDVADYRAELERRGYTFITEEPEYDPEEIAQELSQYLDDWTYWNHPSLTIGERNPGLTRRRY